VTAFHHHRRRLFWRSALFILTTIAIGCGPTVQVYSYWGPGVRFSETTRTYAWAPGTDAPAGEGRPRNPNVDPLIRQAVEKDLGLKGYEKAEGDPADFWIDYRVARDVRGDPYGAPTFSEMTEGFLALYAINPDNGKLIWRGQAEARLDDSKPPGEQIKNLDYVVRKILDQIPPRPGSVPR